MRTSLAKQSPTEEYMGKAHVAEFFATLTRMLKECDEETLSILRTLREGVERSSDDADSSDAIVQAEANKNLINRLAVRRVEIEAALRRIESGEYGYCEETGEEIGLARLRANPLTRLCIEAATRKEHLERLSGGRML